MLGIWKGKKLNIILAIWSLCGIIGLVATGLFYLQWNGFGEQGEVNFAAWPNGFSSCRSNYAEIRR